MLGGRKVWITLFLFLVLCQRANNSAFFLSQLPEYVCHPRRPKCLVEGWLGDYIIQFVWIALVYTYSSGILLIAPTSITVGEGDGTPLRYSCLENPRDGGSWWAAIYGVTQSRTRLKRLSMHACIGEGNGNPLQCSFLENPRDGGAWWATIYGVTQSWTRLKWISSSSRMGKIFLNPISDKKTT